MPLMAAYEQNDARDAARLLASMTLAGLRDNDHGASINNAINNMYRLLVGYRAHGFYGYADHAGQEDESSMTSLRTSSDRNVGDLREALDAAFDTVFVGVDPDQAIEGMKVVLRMKAFPKPNDDPDEQAVERASYFFETLLQKLEA